MFNENENLTIDFKRWYADENIEKLVCFPDKMTRCLRYVFSSSGAGTDPFWTFLNQFKHLIMLKKKLEVPVYFISMRPGAALSSHFIFGIITETQLIIVNPMGNDNNPPDFYKIIFKIKALKLIESVWISRTAVQKEEGLVSCGPICLELFNHFSSLSMRFFSKLESTLEVQQKLLVFSDEDLEYYSLSKKTKKKIELEYHTIEISNWLPESLKPLLTGNPAQYQAKLQAIRQDHKALKLKEGLSLEKRLVLRLDEGVADIEEEEEFSELYKELEKLKRTKKMQVAKPFFTSLDPKLKVHDATFEQPQQAEKKFENEKMFGSKNVSKLNIDQRERKIKSEAENNANGKSDRIPDNPSQKSQKQPVTYLNSVKVLIDKQEIELKSLKEFNIILGKTGCGKSMLLRNLTQQLRLRNRKQQLQSQKSNVVAYIPAERGARMEPTFMANVYPPGFFKKKPMEFPENEDADYRKASLYSSTRRAARRAKFDGINGAYISYYLNIINPILDNIEVRVNKAIRDDEIVFAFYVKGTNFEIPPHQLSSGENELISLWMGILRFLEEEGNAQLSNKFLLLDEPDVHLHPDSQHNIAKLIYNLIYGFNRPLNENGVECEREDKVQVILVTHSTSFLSTLSEKSGVSVFFMKKGDRVLDFMPLGDGLGIKSNQSILRACLPIFGAHPLTQAFNEKPILLVEGADEDWIWKQAIRSSNGKLKVYPCPVGGVSNMPPYEDAVRTVVDSIYDKPRAYSLWDRDDTAESALGVKVRGSLKRFTLSCRNSESLLLSDEVLNRYKITYAELIREMNYWITETRKDKRRLKRSNFLQTTLTIMESFQHSDYNRKIFDIKLAVEHLLLLIRTISRHSETNPKLTEPWQIAVGSTIGQLIKGRVSSIYSSHSVIEYLGIEFGVEFYPHLISLWFKVRKVIRDILPDDQIISNNGDIFCRAITDGVTELLKDERSLDVRKSVQELVEKNICEMPHRLMDLFRGGQQNLTEEIFRLMEREKKNSSRLEAVRQLSQLSGRMIALEIEKRTTVESNEENVAEAAIRPHLRNPISDELVGSSVPVVVGGSNRQGPKAGNPLASSSKSRNSGETKQAGEQEFKTVMESSRQEAERTGGKLPIAAIGGGTPAVEVKIKFEKKEIDTIVSPILKPNDVNQQQRAAFAHQLYKNLVNKELNKQNIEAAVNQAIQDSKIEAFKSLGSEKQKEIKEAVIQALINAAMQKIPMSAAAELILHHSPKPPSPPADSAVTMSQEQSEQVRKECQAVLLHVPLPPPRPTLGPGRRKTVENQSRQLEPKPSGSASETGITLTSEASSDEGGGARNVSDISSKASPALERARQEAKKAKEAESSLPGYKHSKQQAAMRKTAPNPPLDKQCLIKDTR